MTYHRQVKSEDVLTYLRGYLQEQGCAPSLRTIGKKFSLSSTSSVKWHLGVLRDQGHIDWSPGEARSIRLLSRDEQTVHIHVQGDVLTYRGPVQQPAGTTMTAKVEFA